MAAIDLIAGTKGKIIMGAAAGVAAVNLDEYSCEIEGEDLPAVGFEDFNVADGTTYDDGQVGIIGATVTGSGFWNANQNPHNDPPAIKVGQLPAAQLYANRLVVNRFYKFTQLRMLRTRIQNRVRGRLEISFSAKSNGRIIYPIV